MRAPSYTYVYGVVITTEAGMHIDDAIKELEALIEKLKNFKIEHESQLLAIREYYKSIDEVPPTEEPLPEVLTEFRDYNGYRTYKDIEPEISTEPYFTGGGVNYPVDKPWKQTITGDALIIHLTV